MTMATITDNIEQHRGDVDRLNANQSVGATGSEPLRIAMSREEIEDKAKAYLLEYFDGKPNDDFYLRLGMMVDFSHFLFQNSKSSCANAALNDNDKPKD